MAYHQDAAYITDQFRRNRRVSGDPSPNSPPSLSVTAWIALDDVTEETGTIEYAEGSHRWLPKSNASPSSSLGNAEFHAPSRNFRAPALAAAPSPKDVKFVPVSIPAGGVAFHYGGIMVLEISMVPVVGALFQVLLLPAALLDRIVSFASFGLSFPIFLWVLQTLRGTEAARIGLALFLAEASLFTSLTRKSLS